MTALQVCVAAEMVLQQIQSKEKRAVYTHCYGHYLNLAVGSTLKQSDVCSDALAFETSKLIKFSPKKECSARTNQS